MKIGSRDIGTGFPTFIIAEIGSNWRTLDDCCRSIREAAKAGADCAKFQMFTQEELYGYDVGKPRDAELPRKWLPALAECAESVGIEFMVSCFSPEGVRDATPFVSAHKIASCEANHYWIRHACMDSRLPVFLSLGALEQDEADQIISDFRNYPLVPMYCTPSYPARDSFPLHIRHLRQRLGVINVGFSDHSMDVKAIPYYACHHLGACAIEKHVNFVGATGPDADHSLTGKEFAAMVDTLRGNWDEDEIPQDILAKHKRRQVVLPDGTQGLYRLP